MVAVKTAYPLETAVAMLKKFKASKFDETVELHINVREKGVSGQVTLPHGTGKKRVITIADDAVIADIEKGKINFDILVAHPSMMPKLAKVARILGPRGLMPNPKNGTVTPNVDAIVEKLSAGQVNFKTESDAPIIHMSIGKISFTEPQITENVQGAISAIKLSNITKITMKSTMSPALNIDINSLGK
jgi:large subunit ribosomal protein L1